MVLRRSAVAPSFTWAVAFACLALGCGARTDLGLEPLPQRDCDRSWSQVFGSIGGQYSGAIALHPNGDVTLQGTFRGSISFGGPVLETEPDSDRGFIARLDACGRHVHSKALARVNWGGAGTVVADASGNTVFLESGGVALVKLDPAGIEVWRIPLPSVSDSVRSVDVAVGPNDDIAVVGTFSGTFTVGGISFDTDPGTPQPFVLHLDRDGQLLYGASFAQPESSSTAVYFSSVAVAQNGDLVVSGTALPVPIDLGGGPLQPIGPLDVVLLRLRADGEYVWARRFGGSGEASGGPIAIDPSARIVVAGILMSGRLSFGGDPLDFTDGSYLAVLDADGDHIATQGIPHLLQLLDVSIGPSGNPLLVGQGGPGARIGDVLLDAPFVAELDGALSVADIDYLPCTWPVGALLDPAGGLFVAGDVERSCQDASVGGVPLSAVDGSDPFIVRLAP